jgi:hypothetical protein
MLSVFIILSNTTVMAHLKINSIPVTSMRIYDCTRFTTQVPIKNQAQQQKYDIKTLKRTKTKQ